MDIKTYEQGNALPVEQKTLRINANDFVPNALESVANQMGRVAEHLGGIIQAQQDETRATKLTANITEAKLELEKLKLTFENDPEPETIQKRMSEQADAVLKKALEGAGNDKKLIKATKDALIGVSANFSLDAMKLVIEKTEDANTAKVATTLNELAMAGRFGEIESTLAGTAGWMSEGKRTELGQSYGRFAEQNHIAAQIKANPNAPINFEGMTHLSILDKEAALHDQRTALNQIEADLAKQQDKNLTAMFPDFILGKFPSTAKLLAMVKDKTLNGKDAMNIHGMALAQQRERAAAARAAAGNAFDKMEPFEANFAFLRKTYGKSDKKIRDTYDKYIELLQDNDPSAIGFAVEAIGRGEMTNYLADYGSKVVGTVKMTNQARANQKAIKDAVLPLVKNLPLSVVYGFKTRIAGLSPAELSEDGGRTALKTILREAATALSNKQTIVDKLADPGNWRFFGASKEIRNIEKQIEDLGGGAPMPISSTSSTEQEKKPFVWSVE